MSEGSREGGRSYPRDLAYAGGAGQVRASTRENPWDRVLTLGNRAANIGTVIGLLIGFGTHGVAGVRALTALADGTLYAVDQTGAVWTHVPETEGVALLAHLDVGGLAVEAMAPDGAGGFYLSAGGRFLYHVPSGSWSASLVGGFPGHQGVRALAFDEEAQRLYGVDAETRQVLEIEVNGVTGMPEVTERGTLPVAYTGVEGLAVDRTTRRFYAADRTTDRLLEIDPATGGAQERARLPRLEVADVTYSAAGDRFVLADEPNGELVPFDAKGHDIRLDTVAALDYDAQGQRLLGVHAGQAMLLAVHPETGWKEWVGWVGIGGLKGLAVDGANRTAYAVDVDRDMLVRIDTEVGTGTDVGLVGGASRPWGQVEGLAFDTDQGVLYGLDKATGTLLILDRQTAAATAVNGWVLGGLAGLAYEPGTPGRLHAVDNASRQHVTITLGTFAMVLEPIASPGIEGLGFDAVRGVLWGSEPQTGQLVEVWRRPAPPVPAFTDVRAVAKVGAALFLYDAGDHRLKRLDLASGTVDPVADLGNRTLEALTFQPSTGLLIASDVGSGRLLTVNPVSGEVQILGSTGFADVRGLAIDETSGLLHGVDRATQTLLVINPATAAVAYSRPLLGGTYADLEDLCWDADRGALLAVDAESRTLLSIDPLMGLVTLAVPIEPAGALALVYLGSDVVGAVDAASDALVRIDRFTGSTVTP